MKIILLENIKNLGEKGAVKEVAEGYARNFLLPKKLVAIATQEAEEKIKKIQEELKNKEREEEDNLKKIASEIKGKKIKIKAKAKKGKLFGSIGAKEILKELEKESFKLEEKSIILEEPLKTTGERKITIELGKNIKTEITVDIQEE